jgi:hypothetical protein
VLVAHTCNPSYSEGRDQEDRGSKPAQANSSTRSCIIKPLKNSFGGVAQGEGPQFKPQYHKKIQRIGHISLCIYVKPKVKREEI